MYGAKPVPVPNKYKFLAADWVGIEKESHNVHTKKNLISMIYSNKSSLDRMLRRHVAEKFKNKINLLTSMVHLSAKANNEIYITEANWPLENTAPYAPTSEKECVSESDYSQYMQDYIKIAKGTNKIDKLYWHQLVAPGYGLVDNRDGVVRKTLAFYKFKQLLN